MYFGPISGCRKFDTIYLRGATLILGLLSVAALAGSTSAARQDGVPTTADRLIGEAGQAKTDGQLARAYALLHEVVRMAPDHALARWQLGQVKVDGEWLSIEESQRRAEADPRQVKYRERKEAAGDTPQAQLALARFCRNNKLDDEAPYHWASVLSVDSSNKEALRAVGRRWYQSELLTPGEIKTTKIESSEAKQSTRQWASRVAGWMRALSDKNESPPAKIVDEIRAIDDPAAIPVFEAVTLSNDLSTGVKVKGPGPERLSLAFVKALDKMREEPATNSLLRYAVLSQFAQVRGQAISELRYRSLFDYVPQLLDGLVAPLQSSYRVVNDPDGSVHYLQSIYREGPFADWAYRSERSIFQPGSIGGMVASMMPSVGRLNTVNVGNRVEPAPSPSLQGKGATVTPGEARQLANGYEREIMNREQRVAQTNQQNSALNDRIFAVLTGTTDQKLGSGPRAWWSWWQDYTDYYRGGDRPIYGSQDSSSNYIVPPVQPVSVECFARGTPVWTKTGQRPIESLKLGDLVLSQDVRTGEIRYKPVMARTLRPVGPIVQIATHDEKLLATRGHPLWVDGVGWRMAKELGDGAMLHSLAGAGRIDTVQPAIDAETYNLVVADFNTYFVGVSGILAHDNTPRKPTQSVLPGIARK
jgi:hypothetical protein